MEIEEGLEEAIAVANAYLQGVLDVTHAVEKPGVDTWYAYKNFDINVDGSDYHGGDEDTLRVYVYRNGNILETLYEGEKQ